MNTKICTKCKTEKEVKYFGKDKSRKTGMRPECRDCQSEINKIRMQRPEARQKQREADKRYRERHPERVKEMQRREDQKPERRKKKRERAKIAYHENPEKKKAINKRSYEKNKEVNNKKKREEFRNKYRNDAEFRKEYLRKSAERFWLKRELFCVVCNNELPKNSQKYCNDCREGVVKQQTKEWREKVGIDYINYLQRRKVKRKVDNLTDGYIAGQIRGHKITGWNKEEIPKSLIELKRNALKLKRELKNQKS